MWSLYHWIMRSIYSFDLQNWLVVFLVVVAAGALCMRGLGSRSSY